MHQMLLAGDDKIIHQAAVGVAQAIVDGLVLGIQLRVRDHLRSVARVLPVDFAQELGHVFLVLRRRVCVDEIIEAGQLMQAVLTPEFVEARHAVLAVADQVQRGDVDLAGGRAQPRQGQVLQELGRVAQRQQPEPVVQRFELTMFDQVTAKPRRRNTLLLAGR